MYTSPSFYLFLSPSWLTDTSPPLLSPSQPHVSLFTSDSMYVEKHLGIETKFVGYAYLLDKQGRIRWNAHELATPKEIESLIKLTKILLKE